MYTTKTELETEGTPYDTDIPQDVWKRMRTASGTNPYGHIVVAYPEGFVFGTLTATDRTGEKILAHYLADAARERASKDYSRS
jgi:hypothetical protein